MSNDKSDIDWSANKINHSKDSIDWSTNKSNSTTIIPSNVTYHTESADLIGSETFSKNKKNK